MKKYRKITLIIHIRPALEKNYFSDVSLVHQRTQKKRSFILTNQRPISPIFLANFRLHSRERSINTSFFPCPSIEIYIIINIEFPPSRSLSLSLSLYKNIQTLKLIFAIKHKKNIKNKKKRVGKCTRHGTRGEKMKKKLNEKRNVKSKGGNI